MILCEDLACCKRYSQLKEFQDFCAVERQCLITRVLWPCQTCWPSLALLVRRILEQWQPL
ncbi:Uncharacterized protein FWK35_00017651 [Aphis craccivora]|uniref:Uncharacterized protein n=1 Tax=Aphis craccivora TaxID=307492 RepID=A0A6G0Y872_APHCR|nr:Uncharacterized protein FWK35_00017651 [Aphis craccivora]